MNAREEWGRPMSDTEVDKHPDDEVDVEAGLVRYSSDDPPAADWARVAWIVVPLVVGLLVVATIGARMLVAEIPDPAEGPAPESVPANSFCWDGANKPAEGCPVPSGRSGLRWVFPSFQPNELGCRNVLPDFPASTRPAMYACDVSVSGGPATIVYSQLTQVARGRVSLEKQYGGPAEEIDDEFGKRLLFTEGKNAGTDGDYDLAVMYPALPFAVEVSAASADARDEALESLVRFRASDDVMDHP
jgi:hypothetical protein